MKKVKVLLLVAMVLVISSSCKKEYDNYFQDNNGEIDFGTGGNEGSGSSTFREEGALTLYKISNGELIKVKDYDVPNNLKSYQLDVEKHKAMWEFFAKLIPIDELHYIQEFEVTHSGNEIAGYVTPINFNDLSRWRMGLAIDLAQNLETIDLRDDFTYTNIHEYGHILTLNNTQINVNGNNCNTYHSGEGCANPNSYINRLFEIGWSDIYDEFQSLQSDAEIDDFFYKYEDRFVTWYAASNPAEDVAEVFSMFVTLENKPTGNTIADRKIKMMYDYPELVELRQDIRTQPSVRALKPGSWVKNKKKKCVHKHHSVSVIKERN